MFYNVKAVEKCIGLDRGHVFEVVKSTGVNKMIENPENGGFMFLQFDVRLHRISLKNNHN